MAIKVIKEPQPPAGSLGKVELYALSIGQVIGAGVITLIVPAIMMTGYSAWLAYVLAILMGFFIILPLIFVASALRLGGGYYSLMSDLAGPSWGGVYAFANLVLGIGISLMGVAAASYLGDVFPVLSSSTARTVVAIALLTLFYLLNLMGIGMMAKAQKLMTWILIAALCLFAIIGAFNIKLPIFDFSSPDFMPYGLLNFTDTGMISSGFFAAVMLFVYSCQGHAMTICYGRDAKNAKRDIPFAILISVPTLIVLYVGVAIAAVGSTSLDEFGGSTSLVVAAKNLLPGALYIFFIVGGPIMALLSTLNSTFAAYALGISQSCVDGWLPKTFGNTNKRGASKYILTYLYVIALIPVLLGFDISTITNQIQLLGSILSIVYFYAYAQMPKKYPEAWKNARLHVPNAVFYALLAIGFVFNGIIFWKSCLSITPSIVIFSTAALVLCGILGFYRGNKSDVTIRTSVWAEDLPEA